MGAVTIVKACIKSRERVIRVAGRRARRAVGETRGYPGESRNRTQVRARSTGGEWGTRTAIHSACA